MSGDESNDSDAMESDSTDDVLLVDPVGNWKVQGKFTDTSGAGVLGHNTAGNGNAIGVQGLTDSSSGYGLHTPDDAKFEGVTELSTLGGSLTNGNEITNLLGSNLTVESGTLDTAGTYKTQTFTSAGTTWDALTGLSGDTPVEITVDTWNLNSGRVNIEVDGSVVHSENTVVTTHRMYGASSSVTVTTDQTYSTSNSYDVSGQGSTPVGIGFKDDGSRMFVSNGSIYQYDLGSPWDVTKASYSNASFSPSGPSPSLGLAFKPDGKKLYVGSDSTPVYSYELNVAWDITSAGNEQSFDSGKLYISGVDLKDDGSKLYLTDESQGKIFSWDLSSSWDVTTAGNEQSYAFSDVSSPASIVFTNSGQSLYVTENDGSPAVWEYKLSTPWDISTISQVSSLYPSGGPTQVRGVFARDDDSQMFVTNDDSADVVQYDEEAFDGTIYASVQTE